MFWTGRHVIDSDWSIGDTHDDVYYFFPSASSNSSFHPSEMVIDATSVVDGPSRDPTVTSIQRDTKVFRKKRIQSQKNDVEA